MSKIKCEKCGTEVNLNDSYCSDYGSKFQMNDGKKDRVIEFEAKTGIKPNKILFGKDGKVFTFKNKSRSNSFLVIYPHLKQMEYYFMIKGQREPEFLTSYFTVGQAIKALKMSGVLK